MNIVTTYPPCWDEINKLFKLEENGIVCVATYGDTIHNPFKLMIPPDLLRHEETHSSQQDHHPDVAKLWWTRYLQDQDFRLDQETEAYGEQYRFYCQSEKNRDKRAWYLYALAGHLAGPLYGTIIDRSEAQKRIREYAELTNHE